MKKVLIVLNNFLRRPIIFWKFEIWRRNLHSLGFFRGQYIILTAILSLKQFNKRVEFQIIKLAAFIFEIDYILDIIIPRNKNLENVLSIHKVIDNFVKHNIDIVYREKIKMSLLKLVKFDKLAQSAKDFDVYLDYSYYSIGLPTIVLLLECLTDNYVRHNYLVLSSKILRILSDIATFNKDYKEGGNNIVYVTNLNKSKRLLENYLKEHRSIEPTNISEDYLYKIVRLSLKFYKVGKNFEY